jgi:hypothetical protein
MGLSDIFLHLLETFPFWNRTILLTFVIEKCAKYSVQCFYSFFFHFLQTIFEKGDAAQETSWFLFSCVNFVSREGRLEEFCPYIFLRISHRWKSTRWELQVGGDGRQCATLLRLAVTPILEIGHIGNLVDMHCKYHQMTCAILWFRNNAYISMFKLM